MFSIFYWNVPLLMQLNEWLKIYEEKEEEKQEKEVMKVANWTRLYYMLSHHELEQTELQKQIKKAKKIDQQAESAYEKVKSIMSEKLELLEKSSPKKSSITCNSILYRIIYSENVRSRDIILEIASLCQHFSIQHCFISLSDLDKILKNPTAQVVGAFDNILTETPYTRQIQILAFPGDVNLITFWDYRSKMTESICQKRIRKTIGDEKETVLN